MMKRFHKPENALRRAQELVAVGKSKNAMELLHRQFTSPRFRQWQQAYEDLMLQFFELCVELREIRKLKDGLHHYRNSAQMAAPSSLETVIKHLIHTAERKAYAARDAARGVESTALADMDDLEEGESPESVMLGTVTNENSVERRASSMVVPWVRFLWDVYRGVLENLKMASKMMRVYHATARKAFNFCVAFQRRTELRRLASILRAHLTGGRNKSRKIIIDWTQEVMEEHMTTRFVQLDTATQLELWHEAFRTVEDIHTLIETSQRQPRAQLMAEYLRKLTQIFWVANNHLFHAYAWFSFFTLSIAQNRALSDDERQTMASRVLLAAACVPLNADDSRGGYEAELEDERNARLAELLQFPTTPTRSALIADIRAKKVEALAHPEVAQLFHIMETDFHPLHAVKKSVPLLGQLCQSSDLRDFVAPLESQLLTRLVVELSTVYRTVRISFFKRLITGLFLAPRTVATPYGRGFLTAIRDDGTLVLELPFGQMFTRERYDLQDPAQAYLRAETALVRAAKGRELHIRVDHANQVLRLGNDALDNKQMSKHLTTLATGLHSLCAVIDPVPVESTITRRVQRFQAAAESMVDSHVAVAQRRELIERRKEEFERQQRRKLKEQQVAASNKTKAALAREAEKRRAAETRRAKALAARQDKEAKRLDALKQLKALGEDISKLLEDPTSDAVGRLEEVRKRLDKEQAEQEAKARRASKQLDFLTRATREAEWKRLKQHRRELLAKEKAAHEAQQERLINDAREKHAKNMAIKARLARLKPFTDAFLEKLATETLEARRIEREREQADMEERVMNRLYRARNKMKRRLQELREQEEAEEARRQAEEAEARRHAEAEALRAQRAAEDAERQRQREAQAAERRARLEAADRDRGARGQDRGGARDQDRGGAGAGDRPGVWRPSRGRFGGGDRGFGGRDSDRDRGFGGRDSGRDRDADRDRGFGGRDRDADRDRGFGGRDRDADRDRGFGGGRDRDRDSRGFGGGRDRDRDSRGFGRDRDDRGSSDRWQSRRAGDSSRASGGAYRPPGAGSRPSFGSRDSPRDDRGRDGGGNSGGAWRPRHMRDRDGGRDGGRDSGSRWNR